jgi:hypothetical protein
LFGAARRPLLGPLEAGRRLHAPHLLALRLCLVHYIAMLLISSFPELRFALCLVPLCSLPFAVIPAGYVESLL